MTKNRNRTLNQGVNALGKKFWKNNIFIPVTRRVKGYTRFVGRYATGRRKQFRPYKAYIFLIRITSRVDVRLSVRPLSTHIVKYYIKFVYKRI